MAHTKPIQKKYRNSRYNLQNHEEKSHLLQKINHLNNEWDRNTIMKMVIPILEDKVTNT